MRRASCHWTGKIRALTLAFALLLQARGSVAHAQDEEYKALTDAAVEEHSLGHYEEARALFARAHAIAPSARTLWGMGIAAFEARNYVEALQLLTQARDDARRPLTAAQRKKTDSLLERARAYVVRLPVRLDPPSASLAIDGRTVAPDTDGVVLLDAGAHQVVVSADGYQDAVRSMIWHAGDAAPFEVRLKALPRPGPEPPVAQAAPATQAVTTPAPQDDAPGPRKFAVLKWVSLGAALASLGVMGAGVGLRAGDVDYYNDESHCPGPDKDVSCPGKRLDVRKWEAVSIAAGVSAGVFGALTVAFFVLDKRARAKASQAYGCGPAFQPGVVCRLRF